MARWVAAAGVLVALFAVIYAPAFGHGFMKDDFRWIAVAELRQPADLGRIFTSNTGFYRPLVTSSFAMDRALWHLDPHGYAVTNALVLAANAGLLFLLASRLSLPAPAALFAVAVWAFNFHGINMALLWISGRTTLLLCLFAQASVLATLTKHRLAAGLLALCAMLCKEEAVMLPPLMTALYALDGVRPHESLPRKGSDPMTRADSWGLTPLAPWVALAVYALLREQSGAFGFFDAPAYYMLTFAPAAVLTNAVQYLDRGATTAALAAAAMWMVAPRGRLLDDQAHRIVVFSALWFVAFYAITVFVPYRSSLYAVTPSIGSALVSATLAARAWREASPRFARATAALIAIVALLVPVYRSRNHGLIEPQDLAMQSLITMQEEARQHTDAHDIVLVDDPAAPVRLADAFGELLPDAARLFVGMEWRATIRSPTATTGADKGALVFELRGGQLVQDE
jgi:hypothetical protein